MDTGISTHADLNIVGGRNFTTSNVNDWIDRHGHGTHVAGIAGAIDNLIGVVGVAPGVRLWAIKVLNDNGSGSYSVLINALDWILNSRGTIWTGYGVINMSLAGPSFLPLDDAIATLTNNGIVVVVAGGNNSTNSNSTSPARAYSAITVGASGHSPNYTSLAYFSNYGAGIDILAPGVNILSTYVNNRYAILSGTSMASPVIAGTCALLASTLNLGTPTTAGYVGNVNNTLKYVSGFIEYSNYDGTVTHNPRIILSSIAALNGTTNIGVRSGSF